MTHSAALSSPSAWDALAATPKGRAALIEATFEGHADNEFILSDGEFGLTEHPLDVGRVRALCADVRSLETENATLRAIIDQSDSNCDEAGCDSVSHADGCTSFDRSAWVLKLSAENARLRSHPSAPRVTEAMVDRGAVALHENVCTHQALLGERLGGWESLNQRQQATYRDAARTVLTAALSSPSPEAL